MPIVAVVFDGTMIWQPSEIQDPQSQKAHMPIHLKLIARFANSAFALVCVLLAIHGLSNGKAVVTILALLYGSIFAFNLYLIEKSALALSEEEWLKADVRKTLLHWKQQRMAKEDAAGASPPDRDETQ
jgi:hypothetical protein